MTDKPGMASKSELRLKAERLARAATSAADLAALAPGDIQRLAHELQVHQIELEMQNDELRQAQAELEASRARYFELYDLAPVGYLLLNRQGGILQANLTAADMLGLAREKLVNYPFSIHIHATDHAKYAQKWKELLQTGAPQSCRLNMLRRGRQDWCAHVELNPGLDQDGAPAYHLVLIDVTDRQNAEDAQRASEERLREVLENSLDAAYKRNLQTDEYDYLSPVFTRLTGYTLQEMKNLPIETVLGLIHPQDQAEVERVIARSNAGQSGATYRVEYRFKHKDGRYRWFLDRFTFLRAADGQPLARIGSVGDISARKEIEAALQAEHDLLEERVRERTAELQSSNLALGKALRARDEFMAAMSHELRTPLTGVLGLAQVLQLPGYGALTEKQHNAVVNIEHSGQRLLNVINDVLDYTVLQSGGASPNPTVFSLEYACQTALRALSVSTHKKNQQTSLTIQPPQIELRLDERRLNQALSALLQNASKFTPPGGALGLEVRGDPAARSVAITVWDTGIGIQAADFPRLFQPFTQLDASLARQYEGAGLGLALVKQIMELLGGTVAVENVPAQGSRFTLSLPWRA